VRLEISVNETFGMHVTQSLQNLLSLLLLVRNFFGVPPQVPVLLKHVL
jgi:hypothetical protein